MQGSTLRLNLCVPKLCLGSCAIGCANIAAKSIIYMNLLLSNGNITMKCKNLNSSSFYVHNINTTEKKSLLVMLWCLYCCIHLVLWFCGIHVVEFVILVVFM